jgi:hypothetical protein
LQPNKAIHIDLAHRDVGLLQTDHVRRLVSPGLRLVDAQEGDNDF